MLKVYNNQILLICSNMELNSLIFSPCQSTVPLPKLFGKIVYIPCDSSQWILTAPFVSSQAVSSLYQRPPEKLSKYGCYKGPCIPCLFLPSPRPSSKILIYFHGNAEDMSAAIDWLLCISKFLSIHVLAMEYRGYGVYPGEPSAENVMEDADTVYRYVSSVFNMQSSDILIFGRSIGSGPACYLASKYNPSMLILMSAFTSLRAVAKRYVGPLLQYLVAERFNNKKLITKVKSPIFLLHGRLDDVVPVEQAVELSKEIKGSYKLKLSATMDHNTINFCEDFMKPLKDYYQKELNMSTKPTEGRSGILVFPLRAFNKPMLC